VYDRKPEMKRRLELLVEQVNADPYRKGWKDKLNVKLKGAGYNCDNDRPHIESFAHFGADILFDYHDYCNKYVKDDSIPSDDEVSYITEIILALVDEWQIVEFLDGKLYNEQEKEIRRLLKDSMRRRIIESARQDNK